MIAEKYRFRGGDIIIKLRKSYLELEKLNLALAGVCEEKSWSGHRLFLYADRDQTSTQRRHDNEGDSCGDDKNA